MTDITLASIEKQKAESIKQGFTPIILVINEKTLKQVLSEIPITFNSLFSAKLLGLTVILDDRVPDFQVIDNRSWVYQKF